MSATATSLAPATTTVPLPPQEPIDPPGARSRFPTAYWAVAALIFGVGASLGLLSGALLMRQRLLRGRLAVGESVPPAPLRQRQQPVVQQPVVQQPVEQQPVEQQPVEQQPVEQQPVEQQPVDPRPTESAAVVLTETSAPSEIRFVAWLVPAATTIVRAALREAQGIYSNMQGTTVHAPVRLRTPIEASGDDVERALFEQCKDESAVAQVFERLRGAAAERAAVELSRALDVDILDVLAQGWVKMPAMHRAVLLSALRRGPPVLVNVGPHNIASTSQLVLDTHVAGNSLPSLELALEIVVDVQSATLAARDGRIELVTLGEATVLARLNYKSVLVKEHATEISGALRDSSEARPPAAKRPASVDYPI